METQLEAARSEAFALLGTVVTENYTVGRRSYGASLKPELKRRTADGFDERELGFASFSDFLLAAAASPAQAIEVHKAPKGPDYEVTPAGKGPLAADEARVATRGQRAPRMRGDVWACFVDWRQGWTRVYHRGTDRAVMFPSEPTPLEKSDIAETRRRYHETKGEYVEIQPIPFETQVGWMREFAGQVQDGAAREVLLFAVGRDRPAREFTDALLGKPELLRDWRARRLALVTETVRAWMSEHELHFELTQRPAPPPSRRYAAALPLEAGIGSRSKVRDLLHDAIERMPESELLKLAIPIEYLVAE
jgi:hypothetical protein